MAGETRSKRKRKGGRRRFGSTRQLDSGMWQASYIDPVTKKRINAPVRFKYEKQADAWLANIQSDITRGVLGAPTTETMPFAEYADRWLTKRPKPFRHNTLKKYESLLRLHILPTFGQMALGGIESKHVSDWYAGLGETTGQSTRATAYTLLHAILRTAAEHDKRIPANPCSVKDARSTPEPTEPEMIVGPPEVAQLAAAVLPRYRAMVLVNFYGHLRFGELIGLRRCDIDLEAGAIRVNSQLQHDKGKWRRQELKTKSSRRTLHLPPAVMDSLAKHLVEFVDDSPGATVFTTSNGKPVHGENYNKMLKDTAKKLFGLSNFRSHWLRHAGLTLVAQSGGTMKEVMDRAGHNNLQVAMGYQHATMDRDRQLAERLNASVVIPD